MAVIDAPLTIKRYPDWRLYDGRAGRCATLDDLADGVEEEEDLVIDDARTGADITRAALQRIIIERARHG